MALLPPWPSCSLRSIAAMLRLSGAGISALPTLRDLWEGGPLRDPVFGGVNETLRISKFRQVWRWFKLLLFARYLFILYKNLGAFRKLKYMSLINAPKFAWMYLLLWSSFPRWNTKWLIKNFPHKKIVSFISGQRKYATIRRANLNNNDHFLANSCKRSVAGVEKSLFYTWWSYQEIQ